MNMKTTAKQVSPYKTELDAGNAYWMARLSQEIYLKRSSNDQMPDEEQILQNLKLDDDKFMSAVGADNNSAQAALVEHEDFYAWCLEEQTSSLTGWITSMLFPPRSFLANSIVAFGIRPRMFGRSLAIDLDICKGRGGDHCFSQATAWEALWQRWRQLG